MSKPDWWPKNPYKEKYYRPAESGGWEAASNTIWACLQDKLEEVIELFDEPEKSAIQKAFGISG